MHCDGGVAEHGLGAGRGDGQVPSVTERIAEVPELAILFLLLRLLVGEGGEAAGAPVDDVVAAVDEVLLVQPDEHLAHRPRESFVEREVGPVPVATGADGLQLFEDGGAGGLDVLPDPIDEGLATEVEARLPVGGQHALDHVLRGDAGVVGARQPEHVAPPHPLEADDGVLDGVVEAVAHVQPVPSRWAAAS